MHKLGISVYPDKTPKEEVQAYMEMASKYGFTRIFTCFLSVPDEKLDSYLVEFKDFLNEAHKLGFEVAVDTNNTVFDKLKATPTNLKPFKDLGVDIIRLDGDFGPEEDVLITRNPYNIQIEFNGSMDMGLDLIIEKGANHNQMIVCHNFYPERYTGLDLDYYEDLNVKWKDLNLRTAAFVSSNNENTIGPWQVFCGLPTVEIHRGQPIDFQARHLLACGNLDDIIVGNYPATEDELKALSQIDLQNSVMRVDVEEGISDLEKEILFDFAPHRDRYDHSTFMVRSSYPRVQYKGQTIKYRPCNQKYFEPGDVLIVNENLAHYQGELEIVTSPILNDGERNLVAKIKDEELILLEYLQPGHPFKLIK